MQGKITFVKWKADMMLTALHQAKLLCDMSQLEGIKIEPEQLRKNIATIQSILHDTTDILMTVISSSSSDF